MFVLKSGWYHWGHSDSFVISITTLFFSFSILKVRIGYLDEPIRRPKTVWTHGLSLPPFNYITEKTQMQETFRYNRIPTSPPILSWFWYEEFTPLTDTFDFQLISLGEFDYGTRGIQQVYCILTVIPRMVLKRSHFNYNPFALCFYFEKFIRAFKGV